MPEGIFHTYYVHHIGLICHFWICIIQKTKDQNLSLPSRLDIIFQMNCKFNYELIGWVNLWCVLFHYLFKIFKSKIHALKEKQDNEKLDTPIEQKTGMPQVLKKACDI